MRFNRDNVPSGFVKIFYMKAGSSSQVQHCFILPTGNFRDSLFDEVRRVGSQVFYFVQFRAGLDIRGGVDPAQVGRVEI